MAGNTVELVLAGDSKSLERAFDRSGQAAIDAAHDFDKASADAKGFGTAMDRAGEAAGNSEGKFMGTADLLDGLGGAFGLPTEKATGLFRAFGDLSGGFEAVQPLFTGLLSKLGLMTGATAAQTAATGAATGAQTGLNAALAANPIGVVVAAIAALVAIGFVVVKNWDTIKSAFSATWGWISDRFGDLVSFVGGLPGKITAAAAGMFEGFKEAFRSALNWIIDRWNGLEFKVPGFKVGPIGYDGFTLGVPDIPKFHAGGEVGIGMSPGTPVPIMALAGETVNAIGRDAGGMNVTVIVQGTVTSERDLIDKIHNGLLEKQRRNGNLRLT